MESDKKEIRVILVSVKLFLCGGGTVSVFDHGGLCVSVFELLLLTQRGWVEVVRTACITPFCRESQETSPISGVMAGHEGYSCSASDAFPPKTSNPFSQPASSEGQLGRTVPDNDWGHVSNKHNCLDGGVGDRDGGGVGEGLSSHNSNDLWLVGSKDRKDPEVPAEDLSWILQAQSVLLDIPTPYAELTLPEHSRLQGVAEKDFGGEHAKQVIITS